SPGLAGRLPCRVGGPKRTGDACARAGGADQPTWRPDHRRSVPVAERGARRAAPSTQEGRVSRAQPRGRRGGGRLFVLRSGAWGIYWSRALARELGCARRESTGTRDRTEAERILRARLVEVAQRRGDQTGVDALRRTAPVTPLDVLVSDFLRALAA